MEGIMKKSMFAVVCLGALSVAGSASALDVGRARAVRIDFGAVAGQTALPPQAGQGLPQAGVPGGQFGAPGVPGGQFGAPGVPGGQFGAPGIPGQAGQVPQGGFAGPLGMGSLGVLEFTALGASEDNRSCRYLADWASPLNPNDVVTCVLDEVLTPFSPSCIANENQDITTALVSAQPTSQQVPVPQQTPVNPCECQQPQQPQYQTVSMSLCSGFNIKGESFDDVALLLGETPMGISGLEVIRGAATPTVYPVAIE
jgi:hypothetical protein